MGIVNQDTKFNGFFSPFSVDNPNRVVITNNQGYAIASDITYQQLIAVISGGGTLMGADNGLHTVGTVVKLGGTLLEPTIIDAGVLSFTVQNGLNNTYMTFAASGSSRGFSVNAYSDSLSDLGYLDVDISKVLLQYSVGANRKSITLSKTISGIEVFDQLNNVGLRYNSDYSANNTGVNFNARWIPDQGWNNIAYIQNQNSTLQSVANYRISGTGLIQGGSLIGNDVAFTANNALDVYGLSDSIGNPLTVRNQTGAIMYQTDFTGQNTMTMISTTSVNAIINARALNPNNVSFFNITNDTVTASIGVGVKNSTSTRDASFGSIGDAFIRSGSGTAGLTLAASAGLGYIKFITGGTTERGRIFATGNWVLQNGGTFTDAGYGLDVVGTVRFKGTNSGFVFQDLVGLNTNVAIYGSNITPSATNYLIRSDGNNLTLNSPLSAGTLSLRGGNTDYARFMPTTGNLIVQNGGVFTDNGFKLDVIGSFRANNATVNMPLLPINATTDFDVTIDASGNLRKSSATIAGSYILNQTVAPQASSVAWLGGGAEALKVGTNTGNPDHAYIGLYPRTATPTTRNAVFGYTTASSTILSLVAEASGHQISIRTTSGSIGITAAGAGNAIQVQADQIQQQTGGAIANWNNVLGYDTTGAQNILLLSTGLGNVPNGSKVILRTNSGTGSVASTLSGNILGQYILSGYLTSTINYNSISIQGLATESWSASAAGSKLEFYTTKNTTIAQVKALTIDQDQSLVHTGNRTGTAVNGIGVDANGKVVNLDSSTLSGSVTTTTATVTTIATIATVSNQVYLIYAPVLARRTDVNGEIATYPFYVTVKNIGGTLTVSSSSFSPAATEDDANYNVSATTSGTNILIQVTGVVGKTINWSIKNGEIKSL